MKKINFFILVIFFLAVVLWIGVYIWNYFSEQNEPPIPPSVIDSRK